MAERQWRVRQASRPECTDQRRQSALLSRLHLVKTKMEGERPQHHVDSLLLHIEHRPGLAMQPRELAKPHRCTNRPDLETALRRLRLGPLTGIGSIEEADGA